MIFRSLIMILLVIVAGLASRKFSVLGSKDNKTLNAYLYYFALPALFFSKILELEFGHAVLILVLGSLAPIGILLLVCFALKCSGVLKKDVFILLALSVVFGSNAFFGVPFFEASMGEKGFEWAIFTASLLGLFGIALSLLLLEYATQKHRGFGFLTRVFASPLIVAIMLGFLANVFGLSLGPVSGALSLLGKTAPGLAIFSLGMFIYDHFSLASIRQSAWYAGFRILFLPLATFGVVALFKNLDGDLRDFLLLQSGIPAAVSLYIFAERYEYKVSEISGMVITTSILSIVTLGTIAYFKA